jgi:hypothetical protein
MSIAHGGAAVIRAVLTAGFVAAMLATTHAATASAPRATVTVAAVDDVQPPAADPGNGREG